MKKEMKKKNNKGFSLVELIVVIAIMAVLMVVLAPAMLRYVEKTRVQKDDSAVSEVANAAELALADETIYTAADGAATITITVEDGKVITAKTDKATDFAALAKDVKATVGEKIDFVSKARSGKKATIQLDYIKDRGAYILHTDSDAIKDGEYVAGKYLNGVMWPADPKN